MKNIFITALFVAFVGFFLAHIFYHYSDDFLNKSSWNHFESTSIKITDTGVSVSEPATVQTGTVSKKSSVTIKVKSPSANINVNGG